MRNWGINRHKIVTIKQWGTEKSLNRERKTQGTTELLMTQVEEYGAITSEQDWLIILGELGLFGRGKQAVFDRLDERFGTGNWAPRWYIDGKIEDKAGAIQHYEDGYFHFLQNKPDVLEWLVKTASDVYDNAESNVQSGLDYAVQETDATHLQDIAVRRVLQRLGRTFEGDHYVQIRGHETEGFVLNPGQVPFHRPEIILPRSTERKWWNPDSVEALYQHNKALLVKPGVFPISHEIRANGEWYVRNGKIWYQPEPSQPRILWKLEKEKMRQKGIFTDTKRYPITAMDAPVPYARFLK